MFCGTENIFCDITYFPHKCATFVVPFVFWFTKMLTLTIFTQNRWGVWLNFLCRFKGYYNVFCGTENIFCDITYFPHKCATFVVPFVFWFTKMLTLTIFTQNRWGVWLKCLCRFIIIMCFVEDLKYFPHKFATFIMCFVEQKTFSVILRIFLTNAPPLWFPLYFGLQKCWRWQFLLKCLCKIIIMCFVEQKTFSVILRIFLTNAPPLWFPLYFGLQKCWRWQFLQKIIEEYG